MFVTNREHTYIMQHTIYAFAPHEADGRVWFAASSGGLLRSNDNGMTWQPIMIALNIPQHMPALTVTTVRNGASEWSIFAGVPGGIVRSSDSGATWSVPLVSSPPPTVSAIVASPNVAHDGTLLAGTLEDGVFCSTDCGVHWHAWNFGLLDFQVLALAISPAFADDQTVFAGTDSGIFSSTTGGRSWCEVAFPMDCGPVLSLALSPTFADDGIVYAGTENYGLHRSMNRGATWTRLGTEILVDAVNDILLAPTPSGQFHVLVASSQVLLSNDGGDTWMFGTKEPHNDAAVCIAAPHGLSNGNAVLVGLAFGGVQHTHIRARVYPL